jgi:prepilin-type N-terminal cleavage/methylation domain-containing protein
MTRRILLRDDRGLSLVEVLVAMVLLTIVGSLVTRAMIDSHKVVRITEDQTQGLADVRIASERLSRDIRDARSVLCNPTGTPPALAAADPTCLYHLQLWIDYNSNYVQEPAETVTWQLTPNGDQFDMSRVVNGVGRVQARSIVTQVAFSYDLPPGSTMPAPGAAQTKSVRVQMTYDSMTNTGTSQKAVAFTARLRNVS